MVAHQAPIAQVIHHFKNYIDKFRILFPFVFYGIISDQRSKDISRYSSGGITVIPVIHGDNDCF